MRRTRPDLIVPIRDRRQHRRILTLRTLRNACFVLVALFAAITIYANLRDRKPHEDFGRLTAPRVASPASLTRRTQIQVEPIEDQTVAMNTPSPILGQATGVVPASTPAPEVQGRPEAGTTPTIVGGPDGVTIVQGERQTPVLHGGFGR